MGGVGSGTVVVQLPWYRLSALHCIMQSMENFDIVLLVNSVTIWCVLMVNYAFVIAENCQHYFHLALNLVYLFWSRRSQSLPLWLLGFVPGLYLQTQAASLVITVFMKFMSWSAHCSKSLAMASQVFCLTVSSLGINFTAMRFMPKSSVILDFTKQNESSNSSESSLIVILWLSSMEKCTLSIISWFLPVAGLPECSSLSTDVRPSLHHLNHSLICVQPNASFPKPFWITS